MTAIIRRAGWLIIAGCALTLSGWSLYWTAVRFTIPPVLAVAVSAAFDGAAITTSELSLRWNRSLQSSGLSSRLATLVLVSISSYLNTEHARILHEPMAAEIMFGSLPVSALIVLELELRYQHRASLKRAGFIPQRLPRLNRAAWILFPFRSLATIRRITERMLNDLECSAGVSQVKETVQEHSRPDSRAVRTWAKLNGFEVADRGSLSREIVNAYRAEQQRSELRAL